MTAPIRLWVCKKNMSGCGHRSVRRVGVQIIRIGSRLRATQIRVICHGASLRIPREVLRSRLETRRLRRHTAPHSTNKRLKIQRARGHRMRNTQVGAGFRVIAKRASVVGLGLALGLVAPGSMQLAAADTMCTGPFAYDDLDAQIDEIRSDAAFDCLIVEHEISTDTLYGDVRLRTEIANACGEDVWIVTDPPLNYYDEEAGAFVADGQSEAFLVYAARVRDVSGGDGEVEYRALAESEKEGEAMEYADFRPLATVLYSFSGSPNDFEGAPGSGCTGPIGGIYGCATSASGPGAPASLPLTLVMLGLGLVWIGRRARR